MNAAEFNHSGVSVEVRSLRKSFAGEEVLKGLDFEVRPGEIFVIMGPSGSGKSVLLKHIIGLEQPDSGEILIDGQSIQSPGVLSKYRLAMVFQGSERTTSFACSGGVPKAPGPCSRLSLSPEPCSWKAAP